MSRVQSFFKAVSYISITPTPAANISTLVFVAVFRVDYFKL